MRTQAQSIKINAAHVAQMLLAKQDCVFLQE